jgi:hypothetical protein
MSFRGDGHAVIQPISFPEAEQVLKVTDFTGSGGSSLSGLSTVQREDLLLQVVLYKERAWGWGGV